MRAAVHRTSSSTPDAARGAIILRIAKDRTAEFEMLFEAEQYPNSPKFHERG